MSEHSKPSADFIATRELIGIDSNGIEIPITLAIGLPYQSDLGRAMQQDSSGSAFSTW
jgi:hypothetical protein